jgi:adenosylcobinamide hydrolase
MFEITTRKGVVQFCRSDSTNRWLSTGWDGGYCDSPAAYNVSVPEGWEEVDLTAYGTARRERAGFDAPGPTLFTGVDLQHARRTRCGSVEAIITAGVSNPAALPMANEQTEANEPGEAGSKTNLGTVNIVLGTTEPLTDGALATLLACVVEAKTATLLAETGFPGTTTDAVVVGCALNNTNSERTNDLSHSNSTKHPFAGSATPVGAAARACVREGVQASIASRYAKTPLPESVADAQYGVTTTQRAEVFEVK